MIDRIRRSLNRGLDQVRWVATFLAQRTRAETEIARLLFESTRIEGKIEDLHRDIGSRVAELYEKGEKSVMKDFIVRKALDDIRLLREASADYKNQARNLSRLPE